MTRKLTMMWVKTWRCVRAIPRVWVTRFFEPVFNTGQVLTFAAASIGLYLILLNNPSDAERDALASQWAIAIQAFAYALVGWAAISLACALFIVVRNDRLLGRWYGNRFVYHSPMLAKTIHAQPTGAKEMYRFVLPHVEPGSFVYCELELDGPKQLAKLDIGGEVLCGPLPFLQGRSYGFRLPKCSRSVVLTIEMPTNAVSATVRVFCKSFTIGNPQDQDGDAGNYKFQV